MKLFIAQHRQLAEIAQEFHRMFPYLKIEFADNKHHSSLSANQLITKERLFTVADIRNTRNEGTMNIDGGMTVEHVEKEFADEFDLSVQVLRLSGDKWLVTTSTNDLTLQQQNTMGSLSVQKSKPERREDYKLTDDQ